MSMKLITLSTFVCFLSFGCKRQSMADLNVVNGTTAGIEAFKSVLQVSGQITHEGAPALASCTSTVIGPETILTAAHCIEDKGSIIQSIFVTTDDGQRISGGRPVPHSGYRAGYGDHDIALVIFPKDSFKDYEPIPVSRRQAYTGEGIAIVGYGKFDHQDFKSGGTKRWGTNTVNKVTQTHIHFDGNNLTQGTGQKVFNSQGDSGGPLFNEEGHVAGVSSTVAGEETDPTLTGNYVNVASYIEQFFKLHMTNGNKIAGLSPDLAGTPVTFADPLPSDPNFRDEKKPGGDGLPPQISGDGGDRRGGGGMSDDFGGGSDDFGSGGGGYDGDETYPDENGGDEDFYINPNAEGSGSCVCKVAANRYGQGCTVFTGSGMKVLESSSSSECRSSANCLNYYAKDLRSFCGR